MKKVVLIDDNLHDYRNKHGASFVDSGDYSDILDNVEHISVNSDFDALLSNAECVLMHFSICDFFDGQFHQDRHEAKDIIIEDFSDYGRTIPLVIFSDGDSSFLVPKGWDGRYIDHINKEVFYLRLKPFLENYRDNRVIDLRIIAEGPDYIKENARRYCLSVNKILSEHTGNVDDFVLDAICGEDLARLVDISNPQLGIEYEALISFFEDNTIAVDNLKTALQRISKSFNLYGRNIYPWTSLFSVSG